MPTYTKEKEVNQSKIEEKKKPAAKRGSMTPLKVVVKPSQIKKVVSMIEELEKSSPLKMEVIFNEEEPMQPVVV